MKYFLLLMLAICLIVQGSVAQTQSDSVSIAIDTVIVAIDTVKSISIIGVGDLMLGSNFPSKYYLPTNNNCYPLLADVKNVLQGADLTIGNLEGCFSDTAPLVKRCKDSTLCYAFRMPEKYVFCLKDAGFDVLTIANNHSGDFGDLGRETTVKLLDSLEIKHAGWLKYPTSIITVKGLKIGIAAFSPNSGTVSIIDTINAKYIVANLADSCDIVIVTFHGGAEGSKHQHVTKETETFYGENRGNVYEFSRAVIHAGADVVFGHGPHVARAIDIYHGKIIAYSLGNFCTYGRFNLKGPNGLAPILKINIDVSGNFLNGKIISAKQPGGVGIGTEIDEYLGAAKIIRELTQADLPESKINIDTEGNITVHP
ncbi:MAG: CapA family protein [Salinivirgaceae bacterium]|nr:CapA family protein [Salinivirgaceae bacterium]